MINKLLEHLVLIDFYNNITYNNIFASLISSF